MCFQVESQKKVLDAFDLHQNIMENFWIQDLPSVAKRSNSDSTTLGSK